MAKDGRVMGKKKHGKKHHGKYHDEHHAKHDERAASAPSPLAGLAAMAVAQANNPMVRQMIAGALGTAAQALAQRTAATPPARPATQPANPAPAAASDIPPVPPVTPDPKPAAAERTLPPRVEQAIDAFAAEAGKAIDQAATIAAAAIDQAAQALERWASRGSAEASKAPFTDPRPASDRSID